MDAIKEYLRSQARKSHEAQKKKAGGYGAYREEMTRRAKLGGWPKGRPRKINVDSK